MAEGLLGPFGDRRRGNESLPFGAGILRRERPPTRRWRRAALVLAVTAAVMMIVFAKSEEERGNGRGLLSRALGVARPSLPHHKDLFPLSSWDVWGLGTATIGLMIAAGGGIGGGGILVPVYILLLRFHAKFAIPLSNVTILGGAVANMALNLRKRHPLADRPLIDWDLILVMEPLTMCGALIGSFLNKVLPEEILTVLLVVLLTYTAKRSFAKGFRAYEKESKALEETGSVVSAKMTELPSIHEEDEEEQNGVGDDDYGESSLLLAPATGQERKEEESGGGDGEVVSALKELMNEERATPRDKVLALTGVFIVVLVMNLLKGGGAFPSPVGIVCGSFSFWASTALIIGWLVFISLKVRDYLIKRWKRKEILGYRYVEGDVAWDPVATIKYPLICAFAGFFAGLFGIGGGIVKGPLMLEMGVHPQVASATSATMIFYTSLTATTSFLAFGLLKMDYAVIVFMVGLGATTVGQLAVNYMVDRYNRQSLIILSIASVVALSAVLMGGQGLYNFVFKDPPGEHLDDDGDGGFCSGGGGH